MTVLSSTTALPPVEPVAAPDGGWELMYGGGAHPPVNGRRFDVESAIDGSVIASVPNADRDDLERAQAEAKEAGRLRAPVAASIRHACPPLAAQPAARTHRPAGSGKP